MLTHDPGVDPRRLAGVNDPLSLAQHLRGQIERRASGRIRDLRVTCSQDTIVLSGNAPSYHAKQLALQAVLDQIAGQRVLANQIVVR